MSQLAHVTAYKVAVAGSAADLATNVEKEIHGGWQPFGSPVIEPATGKIAQALVKYAEWYR